MRTSLLTLLLLSCFGMNTWAQQGGPEIYGLNFENSQLKLAGLDPANGNTTIISQFPTSQDGFGAGVSDIDPVSDRYFYVRANALYTVSLSTGRVLRAPNLSNPNFAIAPLTNIAFNWLNDTIYGLQFRTGALWLAATHPDNGQVQVISQGPISGDLFSQGDSDIDPIGRRYFYLRDRNELITVDLNTGTANSRVRVQIPARFGQSAFMNITYNYVDGQIYGLIFKYGTSTTPCSGELYLAKVDPATGALTVLSTNPASGDCFQGGVADIDPVGGRYFYPRGIGRNQEIVAVDTRTGNVVSRRTPVSGGNPVFLTNIAFNELSTAAVPNAVLPMHMGNELGEISMNSDEIKLNAYVGPDAQYQWQDGSTDPNFLVKEPGTYKVDITRDGFTIHGEVKVMASSSVQNQLPVNSLTIAPNPAEDYLSLSYDSEIQQQGGTIEILNIQGKQILQRNTLVTQMPLNELSPGMYFLKLRTEIGTLSKRFIKR